jgi:hypothetical protein
MPPYILKDITTLLAKIPAIPARREDPAELYQRLKTLLDRSPRARLLSILKYTAYIVVLINFGSLPFVWHSQSLLSGSVQEHMAQRVFFSIVRVFWPILAIKLQTWALKLRLVFASRNERTHALIAWAENLSPVGVNPFEFSAVHRRWASTVFKLMKSFSMRAHAIRCFFQVSTISMCSGCTSATQVTPRHASFSVAQHELTSPPSRHSIQRV